tara:strand:+ start:163 stop:300 length:138 start_codon:yes stop_codon:yes gene_type:complete
VEGEKRKREELDDAVKDEKGDGEHGLADELLADYEGAANFPLSIR